MTETAVQEANDARTDWRAAMPGPQEADQLMDRIRQRAYELFELRGCEPGQELADWLTAERELAAAELAEASAEMNDQQAAITTTLVVVEKAATAMAAAA